MSLAVVYGRAAVGVEAPLVTVEVHLANGLPSLSIVGLPEAAVKESKDRVRSAIQNSGFEFPARRITVNLAPADLPKEGGRFDLPIALGILAASGQTRLREPEAYEFAGELALTGAIRPVSGVLPMAVQAHRAGRTLILPAANAAEGALVSPQGVRPADHLLGVCGHVDGGEGLPEAPLPEPAPAGGAPDLSEVRGQLHAKRSLEIAAAGGHSLLFVGPPGTGKSMLASRLPGVLPPMTADESLETASIQSVSDQGFDPALWSRRPFRCPHHSASSAALTGGGARPRPGEISLAHNGVLFLDELPEFSRQALEILREPIEAGRVVISRAAAKMEYPARFQLVAAMNPCSCGYLGDPDGRCRCTPESVARYRGRLSGPLLDRIDMFVEVPRLSAAELQDAPTGESSADMRARVVRARERQLARSAVANAQLPPAMVEQACGLDNASRDLLVRAIDRLGLSARAYHRCLRIARTIADLTGEETVAQRHLMEAIGYRRLNGA